MTPDRTLPPDGTDCPPGVQELNVADELRPRWFSWVYDLTKEGLPWMPAIGRVSYRRYEPPSPWHVHRGCIEVIYCVSGACEYESRGQTYSIRPGRFFVSRPDEPHRQLSNPKGYSTFYLLFRTSGRLNADMRWLTDKLGGLPRLFGGGAGMVPRFKRVFGLLDAQGQARVERRVRLRTAVTDLLLAIADAANRPEQETLPLRIQAVADEMRRHPDRDYPLASLVGRLGMSVSSLLSGFKAVTGFPPHAYLTNCRMERAKADLLAGKRVQTIADTLRFPSPQHFSTTFKKATGQTPRAWLAAARCS